MGMMASIPAVEVGDTLRCLRDMASPEDKLPDARKLEVFRALFFISTAFMDLHITNKRLHLQFESFRFFYEAERYLWLACRIKQLLI